MTDTEATTIGGACTPETPCPNQLHDLLIYGEHLHVVTTGPPGAPMTAADTTPSEGRHRIGGPVTGDRMPTHKAEDFPDHPTTPVHAPFQTNPTYTAPTDQQIDEALRASNVVISTTNFTPMMYRKLRGHFRAAFRAGVAWQKEQEK